MTQEELKILSQILQQQNDLWKAISETLETLKKVIKDLEEIKNHTSNIGK